MNKLCLVGLVAATMFFSGCGTAVNVFHDQDPSADFSKYSTYNFLEWTEGNVKSINEIERDRIRVAVARELESRGLKFKPEGADVSVQITVFHREMKDLYPSYGRYYYPYYNPYFGGGPTVYNHLERAISVDIYDNGARKHVWHSAAVGELEYNPQKREELMPEIAGKMFRDFPKQKAEEG